MADKQKLANFVDGAFVPPAEGGYTDVVNPATGAIYAAAPLSTAPDVDAAFAAAERAFGEWGRTTPGERLDHRGRRAGRAREPRGAGVHGDRQRTS